MLRYSLYFHHHGLKAIAIFLVLVLLGQTMKPTRKLSTEILVAAAATLFVCVAFAAAPLIWLMTCIIISWAVFYFPRRK